MSDRAWRRTISLMLGICIFGALDAMIKGRHGGTRNAIGNVSAPWALIPFVSAAILKPRRIAVGALVGAASTVAALASYALVRAARGLGGASPNRGADPLLVALVDNRWVLLGAIGGAALGALGSYLATKQRWGLAAIVIACLLVLEPVTRILWAIAKGEPPRTLVPSPSIWVGEVLCGCLTLLAFRLRWSANRNRTRSDPPISAL